MKRSTLPLYLSILPAFILFTLFIAFPFIEAIRLSFTDWDGMLHESYIGIKNYLEIAKDPYFRNSLAVTVFYTIVVVLLQNVMGLILAVIVDEGIPLARFFRAVFFLPSLLSAVVVGYLFSYILSPHFGELKTLLSFAGGGSFAGIDWLGRTDTALVSAVAVTSWQYMGYTMVIYLGAMQGVPVELYESASLEGAGRITKFFKITFPMIAQAFTINVILTTIGCLKMFDLIWVLTAGGPSNATQTIGIYIYTSAFDGNRAGYATAVSILLFLVIVLISFVQVNFLTSREVEA